ncbi:unnamed protein product [Diatraea saccharalis]|uniref:Cytochrome P450 n=1 Tax=Diatraea saccharalis TaxID=40085 RepID=A0A9N9R2X7_9NEOP|nr:unnamed protein product [Diatraea saccharalis]
MDEKNLPLLVWMAHVPVVTLIDLDDVKAVTNAFVQKPYHYNFGRIWLGNGLVTAPTSIWKYSIKKIGGTFTSNIVNGYQEVFNRQAQKLVITLRGKVGSPPFNIIDHLAFTTLETICQTALGVPDLKCFVTEEYYQAFTESLELLLERFLNPLMHVDAIYKLTPQYRRMKKSVSILHNVSKTAINKRYNEWKEKKMQKGKDREENEFPDKKFKSFLDVLLELSSEDPHFSPEQIQAEVDTIIVGGQETTARSLLFILLMIGCKKQIHEKLSAEIQEIFGDSTRPVKHEDLLRMTYCEAVIMEALRLFPPIPYVARQADKDLQLKSCLVPKGTMCGLLILGAGRSHRIWGPDADQYRPERWLQPDVDTTAFYPFSYGRRSCIGKKYSMALMKTMLAHCIREFNFTSNAENLRLSAHITLEPLTGNLLQVHSRKLLDKPVKA